MKTRTPVVIAAGSLSLVLALTACGNDAADETAVEVAEEQDEQKGGISELLSNLGDNTQEITNYTLTMDMTIPDPEMGDIEISMVSEVMDDPQAVQSTMSMPFLGEMMFDLMSVAGLPDGVTAEDLGTIVVIAEEGQDPLMANQNGLYGDSAWVRTDDMSGMDQNPDEVFDIESLPELAGALAELDQAEETGSETVDGVETTVVAGSMTSEELDELDPAQSAAIRDLIGGSVAGTLDVTLWIDADGFPMRMEFSDDEADVAMEFSAIGSTSFEMPAEEEIGAMQP